MVVFLSAHWLSSRGRRCMMLSVWVAGKGGHRQQAGTISSFHGSPSQGCLLPHQPVPKDSSVSFAH